jgi:uncharacterized HAD superfamily protein
MIIQNYFKYPLNSPFKKIGKSPYEQQIARYLFKLAQTLPSTTKFIIHPQFDLYAPQYLKHIETSVDNSGNIIKQEMPGLIEEYFDINNQPQKEERCTTQTMAVDFLIQFDEKFIIIEANGWGHRCPNPGIADINKANAILKLQQRRDMILQTICESCVNCQLVFIDCYQGIDIASILSKHFQNINPDIDYKIALDLDDTCSDFDSMYINYFGQSIYTQTQSRINKNLNTVVNDKAFWVNQSLINKLDFNPYAFITRRKCNNNFIYEWLQKHNLSSTFMYIHDKCNKSQIMNLCGADILIDDDINNVTKAAKAGYCAILIRHNHNQLTQFPFIINTLQKDQLHGFIEKHFWIKSHRVYKY